MATKSSVRKSTKRKSSNGLSPRTKKAIDTLPSHAQHIYTKIQKRTRTLEQYTRALQRGAEASARAWSSLATRSRGLR